MCFKRKTFFLTLFIFCALVLSGCSMQELFTAKSDKDTGAADQFARSFIETLKTGDMEELSSISTPALASPEARQMLSATVKDLDKGRIISIETIKSRILREYFSKTTRTLMGYQIELEEGWLKAVIVVDSVEGEDELKASTLYIEPIKSSMSELYAFDIYNAPTANYIVLFITIAVPLFIIYAISVCLRMRKVIKYRILWMFFILVGVGTFSFDWSSGQMGFSLFSALMMGSGAYKDTIYGPWVMSFSFPVGAVAFFMYLSKALEKQKAPDGTKKPAASRCEING